MRILLPAISVTVARSSGRANQLTESLSPGHELHLKPFSQSTIAVTFGPAPGIILGMVKPSDASLLSRSLAIGQDLRLWYLGMSQSDTDDGPKEALISVWARTRTGRDRVPEVAELLKLAERSTVTPFKRK